MEDNRKVTGPGIKLKVYHYPPCGTCREAVKALLKQGYELDLQDIKAQPPTTEELRRLVSLSGLPVSKWFNVNGDVYREQGLKDVVPKLSDDEKLALLGANGMLIKRPVISDGSRATIGFREADVGPAWFDR